MSEKKLIQGAVFKKLLRKHDYTYERFGKRIKIAGRTVYRWTTRDKLSDKDIQIICKELNEPVDLFYPEGMAPPEAPAPAHPLPIYNRDSELLELYRQNKALQAEVDRLKAMLQEYLKK